MPHLLLLAALTRAQVSLATFALVGAALGAVALMAVLGRVPVHYSVRNLRVRWRTTVMTALAFTLVIGLLTVMNAFVNGMYQLTENSGHPENVILLGQGTQDEVFSSLAFGDTGDIGSQPGIARDSRGLPLVSKETYVIVNQPIVNGPPGRPPRRFLQVRGLEDPLISAQVHFVSLYEGGEWFSTSGARRAAGDATGNGPPLIEAVIGEGIARTLGQDRPRELAAAARNPQRLDVGDVFQVGLRQFVVAGVMQSAGYTFDSEIWAKRQIVGDMFGKKSYTSMVLQATSPEQARELKTFFTETYKKAAVDPQLEVDYFSSLSAANAGVQWAVMVVALFMALGGVFGVMNTMFAAIAQRTKDIGVMRLIGFSRRQILISLLLESLVLALVGGALGCALGTLANGITANSTVGSGPGGGKSVVLKLVVDANIIAQGMLLALAMGTVGGLVPALMSGLRLKPLEALR